MRELKTTAWAKLNLGLDVGEKRSDGYHEINTVMQTVSLGDDVTLRPAESFCARTNLRYLPEGDKNIAVRAARLFFEAAEKPERPLCAEIEKRIPVCAGMGGGSADAAAVLRLLNREFGRPFSISGLEMLAVRLGADVPFCVAGGTSHCTGRGEIMTRLRPLAPCFFVICKPKFSISTPELFSVLDSVKLRCRPDMDGILSAIEAGDCAKMARRLYNVFEDALPPRCSDVGRIKARLLDLGALGASMTGTGSAVFGVFAESDAALRAQTALKKNYSEVFLATPISSAVEKS